MSETNYEHYKDELIKLLLSEHTLCDFKKENVLKVTQCSAPNIPCEECDKRVREWFDQPYEEPVIEIDWARVPVDTPVLITHPHYTGEHRHFKKFNNEAIYTFNNGKTSWTVSTAGNTRWDIGEVKLAREEDIEKYRKK